MSQTLKSILEVQEAVFGVCGIGWGRRVAELGVSLVALGLGDPGKFNFGGVIDNDIIARAHMERSQAIDEKLWKGEKKINQANLLFKVFLNLNRWVSHLKAHHVQFH